MPTIKQWRHEAKKLDKHSLHDIQKAIEILLNWDYFNQEYSSQGLKMVRAIAFVTYKEKEEEYYDRHRNNNSS